MKTWQSLLAAISLSVPLTLLAQDAEPAPEEESAAAEIEELAEDISDEMERSEAQVTNDQAMAQEIREYEAKERLIGSLIGGFVPYQPTYILPYTYVDTPNQNPNSPRLGEDAEVDLVRHPLVARIVRVQMVPRVVRGEEAARIRGISRSRIEVDHRVRLP